MTHSDFMRRRSFNKQELVAYTNGSLIEGQADLFPTLPTLMFDRIVSIQHMEGSGRVVAEQDQSPDFGQPNCFGVEAIWQLLAFYLAIRGAPGSGIALGCKEISCTGQLRSHHTCLRYEVSVTSATQLRQSGACIVMGDGVILANGEPVYTVRQAQVAAFAAIQKDSASSSSHRSSNPRVQAGGVHHATA